MMTKRGANVVYLKVNGQCESDMALAFYQHGWNMKE